VRTQGDYRLGWLFGVATFVALAIFHLKLAVVLLMFGAPSFLVRYWQRRRWPGSDGPTTPAQGS
jgi:hypothetical protein